MRGVNESTNYDPRNLAQPKGKSWHVYKRLVGYVWRYKTRLFVGVLFALVVAGTFGIVILSLGGGAKILLPTDDVKIEKDIQHTVDRINENTERMKRLLGWAPEGLDKRYRELVGAMREDKMRTALGLSVIVLILALVSGFARFMQEYLSASVATFVTIQLGREMYENLMTLSVRFFEDRPTGEILARLSNDIFTAGRGLTSVFMKLFREPFKALVCLAIAISVDPGLTMAGLCVLPPVAYILIAVGKKMRKSVRRSLEKVASLVSVAKEGITGIHIVKAFRMEEYEKARVNGEYGKLLHQGLKMLRAEALVGPMTEYVMTVGLVGFFLLSTRKVLDPSGSMDGGDLVTLYLSLYGMVDPVRKLASVNNAIQTSVASAQRAFEFIDVRPDVVEAPDAIALPRIRESLRFDNVWFSYDGATDVLNGVDFEVRKGEMVALVGFSGGGKTTIVKLIPRFYDVKEGAITIDGADIRKATFASLRDQIAIVTQDTILFEDTVRANIVAGQSSYPEERIRAAARAARADEFIEQLPRSYGTNIGESGHTLSGGQRQRLAIARALIKDPAILILDEATSNLDSESEQAIQKAIEEFVVGRTTIVIAHRLSTVQRADRILVVDQGRILEQGSHAELLQRPESIYRRLYEVQFAAAPDKAE